MKTKLKSPAVAKSIIPRVGGDTGLTVSSVDVRVYFGETWVVLGDTGGKDGEIIVAAGNTAKTARRRAISKLKKVIRILEDMDSGLPT
jgi:hypothetical protein